MVYINGSSICINSGGDRMIQALLTLLRILYDGVISLIQLIIDIPLYYEQFKGFIGVVNIFNMQPVYNMLIVIVSIGLVIKIKRLVL